MLTAVYRYITHPILQIQRCDTPLATSVLAVILGAVATAVDAPLGSGTATPVPLICLVAVSSIAIWIIQSALTDFSAQLLGHQAPRLALFKALGMTQLPLMLSVPIAAILGPGQGAIGLLQIGSLVLQILTIRTLYQVSFIRAIGIYILPLVLAVAGLISIAVFFGVALW